MSDSKRNGCTLEWEIRNLSFCWLKKGEPVASPTFDVGPSAPTKWSLVLYPRGIVDEDHVGIYLRRENDASDPTIIEVSFQFTFLNKKGSFLNKRYGSKRGFARGSISGVGAFLKQDELFGTQRELFFPDDILIVQCIVWLEKEIPVITKHNTSAHTFFKLNRRTFSWNIDGYSTLRPGQRNHFVIMNEFKKVLMRFYLVSGFRKEINLEILSWDESLKSFSFKIFVIDCEGKKVNFSNNKIFTFECKERCILLLSPQQLMEHGYLRNDALSMVGEYIFSTGAVLHICEENNFGVISPSQEKAILKNVKKPPVSENSQQSQGLVDDLRIMYDDAVLCDLELRTSTKNFPTHKTILGARSSVFSKMFSSDMREKNSGHVDIADLEDDTVHRMLLYIYTDFIEDLQVESASKLYSAADKYAIFSLKGKCSRFLKDNLSPTNACDLLILADRHQDDDLKCATQDYILEYGKEIFVSHEWKELMVTNLQLASDIMYRKVCSNKD